MSGLTKADLEAQVEDLRQQRDAWRDCGPQDDEAMVIARCIVALDKVKSKATTSSYGSKPSVDYERILRYLASRYGVAWPETRTVYVNADGFEVNP